MTTYYVGIGGNDASAGTSWGARKLTLNGAEDIPVAAGDTVYVGPGTYRESLTVDVSGTAGNIITYIGDYTGANTSGTKGVVRITGSADDIALTRANCITGSSKNYRTFRGFIVDLTSDIAISMATCTYWTLDQMHISGATINKNVVSMDTASNHITITKCYISHTYSTGIQMGPTGTSNDTANLVENCILTGGPGYCVYITGVGGVTIRNCFLHSSEYGVISFSLAAGQVTTVNNCVLFQCKTGLYSGSTATFSEDYNTIFSANVARSNVTAGANSVARPALFDTRWFFEMVNGGTILTEWDLASYSTLVEYNSGTGAPSTDIRGASAVGTYREWGPVEYDSTLDIEAGAAAGGLITHPGMGGGIRG